MTPTEAREQAHAYVVAQGYAHWCDENDPITWHSNECDALTQLLLTVDAKAEARTWGRAADIVDECERNRGTLVGSTLGANIRSMALEAESHTTTKRGTP